jgi:hypothetical protein
MNTRELWKLAYGAARRAMRDMESDDMYRSPMAAALDATRAHHTPVRYAVAAYAERLSEMYPSYRVRRDTRVVLKPATDARLWNLRSRRRAR